MSLMLGLIRRNIPLFKWREHAGGVEDVGYKGYVGEKEYDKVANQIVNSLSHDAVVDLVAREWNDLPPLMRMCITRIANDAMGTRSNNKTKGISRLNERLGGKVLAAIAHVRTTSVRRELRDRVFYDTRRINEAKAAAERKYAQDVRPDNFGSLSRAEQKRITKDLAASRRARKG